MKKQTVLLFWDKGEMEGAVKETTLEEDCLTMPILTLIFPEQLGIKHLIYGELMEHLSPQK